MPNADEWNRSLHFYFLSFFIFFFFRWTFFSLSLFLRLCFSPVYTCASIASLKKIMTRTHTHLLKRQTRKTDLTALPPVLTASVCIRAMISLVSPSLSLVFFLVFPRTLGEARIKLILYYTDLFLFALVCIWLCMRICAQVSHFYTF